MGSSASSHDHGTTNIVMGPTNGVRGLTEKDDCGLEDRSIAELLWGKEVEEDSDSDTEDTDDETSVESDSDESEESDWEDDDDEDDDEKYEFEDRLAVLADCLSLKIAAADFLHPERAVKSGLGVRCYFDRNSAPAVLSKSEADEAAAILSDSADLGQRGADFLHPEKEVTVSDPACTGRNVFNRGEMPLEGTDDILEDVASLKEVASHYLQPDAEVEVDPSTRGRCFFDRASVSEDATDALEETREEVLEDVASLKKISEGYLCPTSPVEREDSTIMGRSYFKRHSADEATEEEEQERESVLADVAKLREMAGLYMMPQKEVKVDSAAGGRNFFSRPSADVEDETEERMQVLEDAIALKKLATDYLQPEVKVTTTDPSAYGRNVFSRPSAYGEEEGSECSEVVDDAAKLKEHALGYMAPERSVASTLCGRNYFTKPEFGETEVEREGIVNDADKLKRLAVDYMHPEVMVVADPEVFGKSFFEKTPAGDEDGDEARAVLEDCAVAKKLAKAYLNPEGSVAAADPTAFGRNFFERESAPDAESEQLEEILATCEASKKAAMDYMCPELPISTTDASVFGRNFFSGKGVEDAEESEDVLKDAEKLRNIAEGYVNPASPLITDPCSQGRNIFSNGEEQIDGSDVLEDAMKLKEVAAMMMNPEKKVGVSDPAVFGRNFFERASADEEEAEEDAEERQAVLEDMLALKKLATNYMHPEAKVVTSDPAAYGRNYFSRASAPTEDVPVSQAPVRNESESLDYFEMDLEEGTFNDVRENLSRFIPRPPSPTVEEKEIIDKEEEGNLSRSPSSVMLFDMAEGTLSRKSSAAMLSAMDGSLPPPPIM